MSRDLLARADIGACFEVLLSAIYHRLLNPGDTVIDGGANGGLHTIPMAKLVKPAGHLYGYEPLGTRNVQNWLNWEKLDDVCHLKAVALGRERRRERFFQYKGGDAMSSLKMMNENPEEWIARDVDVVRLDDEPIEGTCAFIKLDLEGGEYDALTGAQALLERDRPIIAFECGMEWAAKKFGYEIEDYFHLYDRLGYEIHDFVGTRATRETFRGAHMAHELVAIHRDDPRKARVVETIAEFNARAPQVPAAATWQDVMTQVGKPFDTDFWAS